jgi:uncharacterized protein YjbJ (UPF0337 family)
LPLPLTRPLTPAGCWQPKVYLLPYGQYVVFVPKEDDMGFMEKLRNKFKMGKGRAKEGVGRATGDPYLETKGQAERVGGAARQVGEQVKDAGKNIKDAFKK